MKKIIFISTLFFSVVIFAQKSVQAKYPLGAEVFKKELAQALNVDNIKGTGKDSCYVVFVVEKDGSLTNIKALGKNSSFNIEAEKALTRMNSKWTPGSEDNKLARSRFRVPLYIDFGD